MLEHARLMSLFAAARSLPDGVVRDTTVDQWRRFLHALLGSGWPVEVDGRAVVQIPPDCFLPIGPDGGIHTVKVWPTEGLQINVFPLAASSIDFDFDTSELRDQRAVDALAAFIELLGVATQSDVIVSYEGGVSPLFAFDFATRRFTHLRE